MTLLEVLVALVVLSVALLALVRVVITNVNGTAEARDRTIAAGLAQWKLRELPALLGEGGELYGSFGEEFPGYTWHCRAEPPEDGAYPVKLEVSWQRGSVRKQIQLQSAVPVKPARPMPKEPAMAEVVR